MDKLNSSPLSRTPRPAATWGAFAAAIIAVTVVTLAGLAIAPYWGNGPVVLLYILPVLGTAVFGGLRPALLAALAATLSYNYFFTAPYRTFVVHSAVDAVTLAVLFAVAIVTSQLAGRLREQAQLAAAHAQRNGTIAGFARRLLSSPGSEAIAAVAVRELAVLHNCHIVLILAEQPDRVIAGQPTAPDLAPSELAAAALALATGVPAGKGIQGHNLIDWHFRPIRSERAALAAVGLAREDGAMPVAADQAALLDSLLDQVALALERASLEAAARDTVRFKERDQLRSRLVAAIGEELKPRLNAMGAAVRELRRNGGEDKLQLVSLAAEVSGLDRYVDQLVELNPAEDQQPLVVGDLEIDLHRRQVRRGETELHLAPKEYALLAELAKHQGRVLSHSHLLRAVWGPAQAEQVDYLRVAVRSLRQKIEPDPAHPALLINEPGVGYRLR